MDRYTIYPIGRFFGMKINYKGFIRSETWRRRADKVRRRVGFKCTDCGKETRRLEIHHETYKRLGHERPRDLSALCRNCHRSRHRLAPEKKAATGGLLAWLFHKNERPKKGRKA